MSSEQDIDRESAKLRKWEKAEEWVGFFFLGLFCVSIPIAIYEYAYLKPIWMAVSSMIFYVLLPLPVLLFVFPYMELTKRSKIIVSLANNRRPTKRSVKKREQVSISD